MKRYICSGVDTKDSRILKILESHNIDTTSHKYELRAEAYGE